jgi:hypothetical protein
VYSIWKGESIKLKKEKLLVLNYNYSIQCRELDVFILLAICLPKGEVSRPLYELLCLARHQENPVRGFYHSPNVNGSI